MQYLGRTLAVVVLLVASTLAVAIPAVAMWASVINGQGDSDAARKRETSDILHSRALAARMSPRVRYEHVHVLARENDQSQPSANQRIKLEWRFSASWSARVLLGTIAACAKDGLFVSGLED
ncbi:hypothetical protein LA080_002899 [Diaporthe eres]|nr:hypothetical protein LA080_002899 [Diaporthe eres]